MMNSTSKTGLIPVQSKHKQQSDQRKLLIHQDLNEYFSKNISRPIEFSIRPFGDLHNPFQSSRCSVLCNHPAPQVLRNIIKNAKISKSPGGTASDLKNCNNANIQNNKRNDFNDFEFDEHNVIPEDLFRRFRDTDSRPLTPSPTNASLQTRTSITGSIVRRCITPEWGKSDVIKRKQIILDLRRSHSQETILSKGPSEISYGLDATKSRNIDQKASLNNLSQPDGKLENLLPTFIEPLQLDETHLSDANQIPMQCINERDDIDQPDRKRGKKKKKLKPQPTFHLNRDPETQISTLGPESVNVSTRPSLIPTTDPIFSVMEQGKRSEEEEALKDSFLTVEAFRILSAGLDIDVLEETFDRYMHYALKEAMKYSSLKKPKKSTEIEEKEEENDANSSDIDNTLPRKLSKAACRFEIPMELKKLEQMSVVEYLSKYVCISRHRKKVFKKIFLKYLDISDEAQELNDRVMVLDALDKALLDLLGYYGNVEIVQKINELIEFKESGAFLTYRTWAGIAAFAERYALLEDIKNCAGRYDGDDSDTCEELEKCDFDTFEQHQIFCDAIPEKLAEVLKIIRTLQRKKYWGKLAKPLEN